MAQAAMASLPVGSSTPGMPTGTGTGAGTPTVPGTPLEALTCPDLLPYPYDATKASLFAFCAAAGLFYILVGYRFFKTTMFLTGSIFGSCLVYNICIQGELMPYYGNAGVSLAAGVLFGIITVLLRQVGLFLTGFLSGLLLAAAAIVAINYFGVVDLTTMRVASSLLGGAIFFALLNLYFSRVCTIINTCISGAALVSVSVDFFLENLWMLGWVRDKIALRRALDNLDDQPCWFSWLALTTWPTLTLLGIVVQLCVTAHGVRHGPTTGGNKPRGPQPQRPRTREQRAELRQNKYRFLYQVRTAHGDVITQGGAKITWISERANPRLVSLWYPPSYPEHSVPIRKHSSMLRLLDPVPGPFGAVPRKKCPSSGNTTPGMDTFNTLQSDSSTHITSIPPDPAGLSALTESEDDLIQLGRGIDHFERIDGRHDRKRDLSGHGGYAGHGGGGYAGHCGGLSVTGGGGGGEGRHSGSSHGRRSPYR